VAGGELLLGLLVVTYGCLLWAARHAGFAVPAIGSLPYYLTFAGRSYATIECQGDLPCHAGQACVSRQYLVAQQLWPLTAAGALSSLGGSDLPILVGPPHPPSTLQFALVVPDGADCYAVYGLQGGP